MKRHNNALTMDGYFQVSISSLKNVEWPGVSLGQDFKMMDGSKVLTEDLRRKIKKLGLDVLLVFWPNKKSDSYVNLTNKITLVFAPKGVPIKVVPWDPWDASASAIPSLNFDGRYKVIEIHKFEQQEYCGAFFRYGWAPLSPDTRDITEFSPCVIDPMKEKIYFIKNKPILAFLKKKK